MPDSATDGNHLYIFLEYVPGGSVAALLNNYGAFEEALVRNFVRQILTGLNYLHERGIIHRDIKGANILVDNKGGIKISDFGISKKAENSKDRGWSCADDRIYGRHCHAGESPFTAGLRFLDGPGGGQTDHLHVEGRHLERRVSSGRNVDRHTSLGGA